MGSPVERNSGPPSADHPTTSPGLGNQAEQLARDLLIRASEVASREETTRQRRMHELLAHSGGPLFAVLMADRICRTRNDARVAELASYLLESLKPPAAGFGVFERLGLRSVPLLHRRMPSPIARAIRDRIRQQATGLLLDAAPGPLSRYLTARRAEGLQVNVNRLGEALVGEREAERRVDAYQELAARSDVDAISVKVSSICSQLSIVAFDATVELLAERLGRIYDAAGDRVLVYLDMEAYEELQLTVQSMMRALRVPSRSRTQAGIVVQAYLPDAHGLLPQLLGFADARGEAGGAPLTLRFVKGANLATEQVHASLKGWLPPTYPDKASVDASYRRLLDAVMDPERARHVRVGVGSHNVFDLAYALCLARERGVSAAVHVELLEGMADPLRRALLGEGIETLVYAPIVEAGSFHSAVAYLVRRLDENASEANFLRRAFGMRPDSAAFELEQSRFRAGLERMANLPTHPRRSGQPYADRRAPVGPTFAPFTNEPDTDFASEPNRHWVRTIIERQQQGPQAFLASRIDGASAGDRRVAGSDPSRPGAVPYHVQLCSDAHLDRALDLAREDPSGWAQRPLSERARVVRRVAAKLREARGELIGLMLTDAGKAVAESDPEVSEAIDFAEYYAHSALTVSEETGGELQPRGLVLVAAPWNFPLAIAAGGSLAALLAGNRVLLKPAPQTPWVASRLAELCWQAGIPDRALQLILCDDEQAARLSRDPRVDAVVLTGATATARAIRRARPEVALSAETGGKNALIVSAVSDREQAVRDAVLSAFAHAGQKCSATSLLICEPEVYDDPQFMETLADAAASLPVGSAYDPRSVVTPLIEAPSTTLLRGLTQLAPGERWLLEPRRDRDNPLLWSPGVRYGVSPGSFTHLHELFGPVLSVMRADDLAHAIELAHQPGYGLTAGLHSLDERQQAFFARRMRAGNLYVNRTTTGAIVRRQPFGGMALSNFGPGAKAGGPNYVLQLGRLHGATARSLPEGEAAPSFRALVTPRSALSEQDAALLARRQRDYAYFWQHTFREPQDPSGVVGEANWLRYLPCPDVTLRVADDASLLALASSELAAAIVGCPLRISLSPGFATRAGLDGRDERVVVEDEDPWLQSARPLGRVRWLGGVSQRAHVWAAAHDVHLATEPVHDSGRVELLHYLREQSLSVRYHRHGHLGAASLRRDLLKLHGHE